MNTACRPVIAGVAILSLASTTSAQPASRPTSSPHRPHIVLFISDDHSWHDCGPYGDRVVRTPQLDRLAREGMRFNLAFAASPTCSVSRSAIYTGLYPFRNGAHSNHSLVRDGLKTLPHYMQALGYRVVIAGKTHIGPRPEFPFEYLANANIMPPGKSHVLWTDLNTRAIDRLLAEHDSRRPLCLVVCSHSPHVFWLDNDGYDPLRIKLPPYLIDTPETRATRCRYCTDVSWMDKQVGEVREALVKHGYADQTLFLYTSDQGAQWPFAKWNLYDAGIRVPLLAYWPGHTRAGRTTEAMVSLVDLLPTMVEAAGATPPSDIDGRSFLQVLARGTDRGRDEVFATHTGDKEMNRAPMRCIRTRDYKYIVNLAPEIPYTTHITKGSAPEAYWVSWLKLAEADTKAAGVVGRYEHRPSEELYDIRKDPYELENLASDPAHADVLAKLREKVRQWRVQQGEDPSKTPMPADARYGPLRYAG